MFCIGCTRYSWSSSGTSPPWESEFLWENRRSGWFSLEGRREKYQLLILRTAFFGPKNHQSIYSVSFLVLSKDLFFLLPSIHSSILRQEDGISASEFCTEAEDSSTLPLLSPFSSPGLAERVLESLDTVRICGFFLSVSSFWNRREKWKMF